MILRRLADAITEQNWFTVVLEVMIVVVGIFIGLQVDDWNEGRKDRIDELVYLERIIADLENSLVRNAENKNFQLRHGEIGMFVLDSLRGCALSDADRDKFATGIYLLAKISPPAFAQAAIEELMSTGRFTIIRDSALRQEIVELRQRHESDLAFIRDVQYRLAPHVNYVDSVAPVLIGGPVGGGQDATWDMLNVDFESLCTNQLFYNSFASALNYNWDVAETLIRWDKRLNKTKSEIEAELSKLRGTTP